jgi:hypothetical protein
MTVVHLHLDDTPKALAVLDALLGQRGPALPGYVPDEWGADVERELLADSHLSTSEKATVHIARGCSVIEAHGGGLPSRARPEVLAATRALAGSERDDG